MGALSLDLLLSPPVLALLGLCVGSFLNVVVHRLPQMMWRQWWRETAEFQLADPLAWTPVFGTVPHPTIAFSDAARSIQDRLGELTPLTLSSPRSRCPECGHRLRWHENIPVLGWLMLRGRCSACKTAISSRYPIVEAATGALFAACGLVFGAQWTTLLWCVVVALLITMALIDLDTTLLPDSLTLPLIGLGLLGALAGWTGVALNDAVSGALVGYGSLWLLSFVYQRLRGVQGMAEGDFKMLAGLGAVLGWKALPSVILLSSAVGAAVGIAMIAFAGHKREQPIPFGPYLAGGGLAALFFGDALLALWNL
ncbi:MAG: prepilin peptidase [Aquincola sp.]|nr:prepilin peptidase [Aquincola sp.]